MAHHDNSYVKKQYISSLTLKQKEAIGLLSIGTFLEYFDLVRRSNNIGGIYEEIIYTCFVLSYGKDGGRPAEIGC